MSTRKITLDILKQKRLEVESYRDVRVYAEWSCGQQDADNEADAYFDKLIVDAIDIYEDNNVYYNMSAYRRSEIAQFIGEIVQEFTESSAQWLANY